MVGGWEEPEGPDPRTLFQSLNSLLAPAVPPAGGFWMPQNRPGAGPSGSLK